MNSDKAIEDVDIRLIVLGEYVFVLRICPKFNDVD